MPKWGFSLPSGDVEHFSRHFSCYVRSPILPAPFFQDTAKPLRVVPLAEVPTTLLDLGDGTVMVGFDESKDQFLQRWRLGDPACMVQKYPNPVLPDTIEDALAAYGQPDQRKLFNASLDMWQGIFQRGLHAARDHGISCTSMIRLRGGLVAVGLMRRPKPIVAFYDVETGCPVQIVFDIVYEASCMASDDDMLLIACERSYSVFRQMANGHVRLLAPGVRACTVR